jgi:hypothetical protein
MMEQDLTNLDALVFPAPREFRRILQFLFGSSALPEDLVANYPNRDKALQFVARYLNNMEF